MASIVISENELLDALSQAMTGEDAADAKTVTELVAETGLRDERIRQALHRIKAQGRLRIHTVYREALDGRMAKSTGYTILPPPKGKRV